MPDIIINYTIYKSNTILGDGISQVIPVWDGYALPFACKRLPLAGQDLTSYLARLLIEQNISVVKTQDVRAIKDKLCHVRSYRNAELQNDTGNN